MYEIVEKLMEARSLKPSDVSKATGIPSSVFTDWKKGRYTPKADKLYVLARFFEVPMEIFFEDPRDINLARYYESINNLIDEYAKEPVFDVAAGEGRINDAYADEYISEKEEEEVEGYSWCRVSGDSMYPILLDGDLVRVKHQTQTEPTDLTVIKVDGESATVKYVEITDSGVVLKAENKEVFEDRYFSVSEVMQLPVTIVGKVVELKRSF